MRVDIHVAEDFSRIRLQSGKTEVENRQCLGDTDASAVSVNDVADKEEDLPLVSQKLRPETRKDGMQPRLAERMKASANLVQKGTKGNLAVYGLRGTAILDSEVNTNVFLRLGWGRRLDANDKMNGDPLRTNSYNPVTRLRIAQRQNSQDMGHSRHSSPIEDPIVLELGGEL
ncbi:unnamed protein product [Darwinula stevensoni]|uniref:Uncharacterized protein n=1 Tax=Darwinula stevensoni TaxID=69355 RepID=A0A7R8XE26_9CRUS|nr:unnamed protein product [Darwinula stevensoni]CAG0895389.1 unnamed protein product [Darwinula stevensoni]